MFNSLLTSLASLLPFLSKKPKVRRHPDWPKVRAVWLKANPECAVCGKKKELEVHHLVPVHVSPTMELNPVNFITLCDRCHLIFGHLGDWSSWNTNCRSDASDWRLRIIHRPYVAKSA